MIVTVTVTAIAGMGIAFAPPAQAAEKERHCVVTMPTASMACYGSFTEAIAKATGGRVTDAPNDSQAAAKDPRLVAQLNATGATKDGAGIAALAPISIMYKDANFRGSSLIYNGNFDCTGTLSDIDYWVELLPSGWNDEIGSYRAYRNCWLMLFEHRGWAGGSISWAGSRTDLGILDDKVSSIRWS